MIGTFTTNDVVDEETQKNDLDMVREVLKVTMEVPHRARLRFQLREKKQTPKATAFRPLPFTFHCPLRITAPCALTPRWVICI
jgi:hypothetical protein